MRHSAAQPASAAAAAPYAGGVSHLRITSTAAYWLVKAAAGSQGSELWRAAK